MKRKDELQPIIDAISSSDSPVGMDAVYVHALILDKLEQLERRVAALESGAGAAAGGSEGDQGSKA